MPDRAYLYPIDPELIPGARNAINVCLRLKPEERITIITDTATREIAAALQTEVERVGSDYSLFVLEHHARRPLKFMPEIILDDLAVAGVDLRCPNAARRAHCANANDQRREQSQNPARSYGKHKPTNHARRHAGRLCES
jgi:leucyl aminopeptidase (aminopeptidase T)